MYVCDIFLCLSCDASHYDHNVFLLYIHIDLCMDGIVQPFQFTRVYMVAHIQYKYITKYVLAHTHTHTIHLSLI